MSPHAAASEVKPFGFDRVFNPLGAEPGKEESAPTADLAEVEALREEIERLARDHGAELARARADGYEAGLRHARGEREAALLAALDAIHAAFETVDERLVSAAQGMTQDAAHVALLAAEMLAGHAVALAPGRAIDEALGRVLKQVARGTRLSVRVSPALCEEIERLLAVRQGFERRKFQVTVLPDPEMMHGDALIAWEEGSLAVDAGARRAAVLAEMGPLLAEVLDGETKEIDPARIA